MSAEPYLKLIIERNERTSRETLEPKEKDITSSLYSAIDETEILGDDDASKANY
jgi:hypothetical protein